jgi:hypothetical protein
MIKKIVSAIMIVGLLTGVVFAEEIEGVEIVEMSIEESVDVEIEEPIEEPIDMIAEEPVVEDAIEEESQIERSVSIHASCPDKVYFGDTITLYAVLEGYDDVEYTVQWQTSKDDSNWHDISSANSEQYSITITEDNCTDYFRVAVTIIGIYK